MTAFKWNTANAPIHILLFGVLLAHMGSYMVVPLLPIFLMLHKGMTIAQVGIILAISPFSFQAGSLIGGWLADHVGRKYVIAAGAWINALAITGFALFEQMAWFIAMGLLSGLGVGLNAPSTKAAIATLVSGTQQQTTAFSLRGIAANMGIAAAGLFTYFVLGGPTALIFYVAAGMFTVLGFISWIGLPKGCGNEPCKAVPLKSYLELFRNKAYLGFSLVSIIIWAVYTQFSLSVPLRAADTLSNPGVISLVWTINSIIVIVLQRPISRRVIQNMNPMLSLAMGMLFIGAGLIAVYWAASFYWFILCGVIFIIGEMLIMPTMDAAISRLGTPSMIGVFFGLSNFISGLGEGAGKFVGGQLLSMGTGSALPWFIYAAAAVTASGLLAALSRWKPLRTSLAAEPVIPVRKLDNESEKPDATVSSIRDWFLGQKGKAK